MMLNIANDNNYKEYEYNYNYNNNNNNCGWNPSERIKEVEEVEDLGKSSSE